MLLKRITLSNFRNYAELDVEHVEGLNVLIGSNAQGKSNLLEAISILATGKSFRTPKDVYLIRDGPDLAVVNVDAAARAVGARGRGLHRGPRDPRLARALRCRRPRGAQARPG